MMVMMMVPENSWYVKGKSTEFVKERGVQLTGFENAGL